jgi:glutamine synthetase
MKGLPKQLREYLFERRATWIPKGDITAENFYHLSGKSRGARYLPETVGRALRSLEEDSIIAVKPCGISVQYKYLPLEMRADYIPTSIREKGYETILFKS